MTDVGCSNRAELVIIILQSTALYTYGKKMRSESISTRNTHRNPKVITRTTTFVFSQRRVSYYNNSYVSAPGSKSVAFRLGKNGLNPTGARGAGRNLDGTAQSVPVFIDTCASRYKSARC